MGIFILKDRRAAWRHCNCIVQDNKLLTNAELFSSHKLSVSYYTHCTHQSMQYRGFSPSNDIVVWFWKLVHSLKEEEKALLLKFATGSPRAPAGGFSTLQVAILILFQ